MNTEPTAEILLEQSIAYLGYLESGLEIAIMLMDDDESQIEDLSDGRNKKREHLIMLREFSMHKSEAIDQGLSKIKKAHA